METLIQPGNLNLFLGALLAVSEILSLTPLKSNSLFQLAVNVLKSLDFTGDKSRAREAKTAQS